MENKPKIPFSLRMTLAMLSGDRQAVDRLAAECIGEMVTKFLDVAHGYDYTDLPFVVATMRTAANSIYMVLDDHGKSLADTIQDRTHCIGVNMDELRMDGYLAGWGTGASLPPQKVVEILYRDGYHSAARLIADLTADLGAADREHELLNSCFAYLTKALPKPTLCRVLRKEIGLTEQEFKKFQIEWVPEDHYDGEAEV